MGRGLGNKSAFRKKLSKVISGGILALLLISVGCSNTFLDVVKEKVTEENTASTMSTITFDKNDADAAGTMEPQTIPNGSTANLTANAFTKTGWTFTGWATTADGSVAYADEASYTMGSADVTLYAKWEQAYTVTYDGNGSTGGSVPVDSNNYEQGQTVTVLSKGNLVKTGYTFIGWNTKSDGTGTDYVGGATLTIGAINVTLYAKWTTAPTYTVTYNGNGSNSGSVPVDSNNYEEGQTVTVLGNTGSLAKTNYIFAGWNTKADGSGTQYAAGATFAMGSADVTLYAKWTINYAITFDKNDTGATGTMADQSIGSGLTANLTTNTFTKNGWTFAGWATTPSGSVEYADGASYTMGSADVTLYAKWTPPTTYSLRDIGPAGGLIFYDKGSYSGSPSWRYLEAAPSDQGTGFQWYNGSYIATGATATAIGTGSTNTTTIVTYQGAGSYAARICDDLTIGIYNDWFLPSLDELDKMYVNLKSGTDENSVSYTPVGGFADAYYWSSTEFDPNYADVQSFYNGSQIPEHKNFTYHVRAVRAF